MKPLNLLLLLLAISIISPLIAQEQNYDYVPFPMENAIWINKIRDNIYMIPTIEYSSTDFTELLFGNIYHEFTNNTLFCEYHYIYIRETEDKKIFMIPDMFHFIVYGEEILLYDFGVEVGDTIFFDYEGNIELYGCTSFTYNPHYYIVNEIKDYELYNGDIRKAYYIRDPLILDEIVDVWVEGLGSINSFLGVYSLSTTPSDSCRLTCFYHNEELLYKREGCTDCICNSVGIDTNNILQSLSISPNPATNILKIESIDYQVKNIIILDISGKEVKAIYDINSNIFDIDINNLAKGIYNIKINTICRDFTYRKFVKE